MLEMREVDIPDHTSTDEVSSAAKQQKVFKIMFYLRGSDLDTIGM